MFQKKKNKLILTVIVFLASTITYLLTVAPTVSFWDCGEFIACANILGVPHPPGTPFFMLLGRFFILLFGFGDMDIGYRVNLISVFGSSLGVTFAFLFTEKLMALVTKVKKMNWVTATAGLVAAFLVNFSDTYWFNAVEAEVYGLAMFVVLLISYLSLKWLEHKDEERGNRYLIAICYLAFLGVGFHLYTVMTLPSIFVMMLIVDPKTRSNIPLIVTGTVLFLGTVAFIGIFPIIAGVTFLFWIGCFVSMGGENPNWRKMFELSMVFSLVALIGYSTYAYIPIRSALNPRIDENNPEIQSVLNMDGWKTFRDFIERKQYGSESMLARALHRRGAWSNQILSHPHMGYGGYMIAQYLPWKVGEGNSSFAKGDTRREQKPVFSQSQKKSEPMKIFGKTINFRNQMQLMTPYQNRMGQFAAFALFHLILFFVIYSVYKRNVGLGTYIGLLYVLASFGLIFYMNFSDGLRSDLGPYNQWLSRGGDPNNPAPLVHMEVRERDYFFVPGYIFMSVIFGIGAGLAALKFRGSGDGFSSNSKIIAVSLIVISIVVPCASNYHIHNRSDVYVPNDYARNLLESCRPNSILFTNGDNDTFPLWYMQEVENVRKDVRVINLSLGNTHWYIQQLVDNEPTVKVGFKRNQISNLRPSVNPDTVARPFDLGHGVVVQMKPRNERPYYKVQDILVINLVRNNYPERPIHFAATVGPGNMMGMENYMTLEGMVYTLTSNPRSARQLNRERTAHLVDNVYNYRALGKEGVYLNSDTKQMLQNYVHTTDQLAVSYGDKVTELRNKESDLNKIIENADSSQNLDSLKGEINKQIALVQDSIKRYESDGINYIENITKQIPWEWAHYYYSTQFYLAIKNYEKAEEYVNKGLEFGIREEAFEHMLSQVYMNQDDLTKAENAFVERYEKKQSGTALNNLIKVYEKQKNYGPAIAKINDWLAKNPEDRSKGYFQSKLGEFTRLNQPKVTITPDSNKKEDSVSKTDG